MGLEATGGIVGAAIGFITTCWLSLKSYNREIRVAPESVDDARNALLRKIGIGTMGIALVGLGTIFGIAGGSVISLLQR